MMYATRPLSPALLLGAALLLLPSTVRAQAEGATATFYRESYALEAKHEYAGALAKMRDATRNAGKSYFSTMRMAWLAYLSGDFAASQADYTAAITAEPKAIEPRLGLTLPLLAARNWKELERACRDVLTVDPHNVVALSRLALAYYWAGNYAEAANTYRQLSADYPSELDYRTGLAWALLKLGRSAEARQVFESVLAVSPDNVSAKQGLGAK